MGGKSGNYGFIKTRSDIRYIPSQFLYPFEYKQKHYVFHVLTKQCIEGSIPALAMAREGFDDLISAHFLVPEDRDECAFYNSISTLMRIYSKRKGSRVYTILPTSGCNARCVYCFEAGLKPITMSSEVVEQTIRYIAGSHNGEKVRLAWFGGEPLLGERIIDRICEGMRENGIEYDSSMISNGSLITPDIIRKMKADWKLVKIQISMDGDEEDYRSRKNYLSYHDYYHRVIENVNLLSESGIPVSIRCNVDEDNWDGITVLLDDLKANIQCKDKVGLYFSPLYGVRAGEDDLKLWKKIQNAESLIEEAGLCPDSFLEASMTHRVFLCIADSGNVAISPDGGLYPCDELPESYRLGDIWNGITNEAVRKEFSRADQTQEKCRKCAFLPDCTSFALCPRIDYHCRELREMKTLDKLKRIIEKKETENAQEDIPIC